MGHREAGLDPRDEAHRGDPYSRIPALRGAPHSGYGSPTEGARLLVLGQAEPDGGGTEAQGW